MVFTIIGNLLLVTALSSAEEPSKPLDDRAKVEFARRLREPMVPIGPLDPAVVVSVLLAGVVAWFSGKALGCRTTLVNGRWRRALYMGSVWVIAGIALTLLTWLLFFASSLVLSGNQRGYVTDLALAAFLLPPLLGLAVAGMHVLRVRPPEDRPRGPA